jgi:hypothetical protein
MEKHLLTRIMRARARRTLATKPRSSGWPFRCGFAMAVLSLTLATG